MRKTADDTFINPYTLTSLAKEAPPGWRTAGAGHGRLAEGRYAGSVDVEVTARSPLLLRDVYQEGQGGEVGRFPVRRFPGFADPVPYLPGSSLAGAVRSLHETLAGGCLRVFAAEFRPGYRDQARARPGAWRLAQVREVDEDGRPSRMELCPGDPVWVESAALHQALGGAGNLRTGARVTLLDRGVEALGRHQVTEPHQVRAGGSWVVLVTDAQTRKKERKNPAGGARLPGRYFCATGELEGRTRAVTLPDAVWQRFLDAVDDTKDMREFRQQRRPVTEATLPTGKVFHPGKDGKLLGLRALARRRLFVDQVVWVLPGITDPQHLAVEELTLAQLWRHAGGTTTAGQRVPEHLLACTDHRQLCPSCRIFGAADTEGEDGRTGRAEQRSYRGHVRFGDAVPHRAHPTEIRHLPPLGSPKPGAGQVYFTHSGKLEGRTATTSQGPPLREWGSEGDHNAERRLRGRKQYWLTGSAQLRPYFRATATEPDAFETLYEKEDRLPAQNGQQEKNQLLSQAESLPAGSVFTFRVHFENLDAAELGGLLCAVDPALVLRDADEADDAYGWAVGGGRPLGFGTVTARVCALSPADAASRYLGGPPPALDVQGAVAAFRASVSPDLRRLWKSQLRKVLRLDWAAPDRVWYPPAATLATPDERFDTKALKPSFTFWNETSGGRAQKVNFPYRQLPSAGAPNPAMKVIPQKDKR
ncbi:TIGR03986 family CRISPR-associated RAMP protein [Streptomyces sp. NPDC002490]|uniref:TIGR03986 family type III CRISPR-associated RAMP protein n=1 Tax=Streptomyces sp. NPDC002490 TaxID=3154416 RepID=UPI00332C5739